MPSQTRNVRVTRGKKTPMPPQGKKLAGIDTKWWLIGGAAAAFLVYHSYKKAASRNNNVQPADGTIDPATGIPYADEYQNLSGYGGGGGGLPYSGGYAIDPLTGVPYAQEAMQSVSPVSTTGVTQTGYAAPTPTVDTPINSPTISPYFGTWSPTRYGAGTRYFPTTSQILPTGSTETSTAQPGTSTYQETQRTYSLR